MTAKHLIAALWRHRLSIGLAFSIAAGLVFRLVWLRDIEYKGDEAWTFNQVRSFWETGRLLPVGMISSAGLPNAGMSLWIFIALSSVLPLDDPLALTRAVELVNIVAILILTIFAVKAIAPVERESWLWSVALVSVNPLAVLFSRKIWPPDLFPIFTVGMLMAWWYRERWWGAFSWGLLGMILGQVQLGGFLFGAAFAGCTVLFNRRSVHWSAWSVGTIAGALPMVPWLPALGGSTQHIGAATGIDLQSTFIQHWVELVLGVDLNYSLGESFDAFLAYPTIGGVPLHVGAALLFTVKSLFVIILLRLALRIWARPFLVIDLFFGTRTKTALVLMAAFWGYGLALTATFRPIYLHYLIITSALPMLWLARLERTQPHAKGRVLLGSLVVAQACLTISFLSFIHETRVIKGDYGVVYDAQQTNK